MSQYGTEVVLMVKVVSNVKGEAPKEVLLSDEGQYLVVEHIAPSGKQKLQIDRDAIFRLLTLDGIYPSPEYWKFCKENQKEIDASIPISLIFNDCQGQKYEKTAE